MFAKYTAPASIFAMHTPFELNASLELMSYPPKRSSQKLGLHCHVLGFRATGSLSESSHRSIWPTPVRNARPQQNAANPQHPVMQQSMSAHPIPLEALLLTRSTISN